MKYVFCKEWSGSYKKAYSPYNKETAKQMHKDKETYSALDDLITPTISVKIVYNSTFVEFIDNHLRKHWAFHFKREENKLYLSMVICRHYVEDSDQVSEGLVHYFKMDGRLYLDHDIFVPERNRLKYEKKFDPAINWTSFPKFNEYDDLINFCKTHRQLLIDKPYFPEVDFFLQQL